MKKLFTFLSAAVIACSAWAQRMEKGHVYVDLGLPSGTMWATCNVGANEPEAYGDCVAWGGIEMQNFYRWNDYKFGNGSDNKLSAYTIEDHETSASWYNSDGEFIGDGMSELVDGDDYAMQTWGGKWRIPTVAQQDELRSKCYWQWTTSYNGKNVNGYIVFKAKNKSDEGKIGGQSVATYDVANDVHIFLPAAGYNDLDSRGYVGTNGCYWSRSLTTNDSKKAHGLGISSTNVYSFVSDRHIGYSIRPVFDPYEYEAELIAFIGSDVYEDDVHNVISVVDGHVHHFVAKDNVDMILYKSFKLNVSGSDYTFDDPVGSFVFTIEDGKLAKVFYWHPNGSTDYLLKSTTGVKTIGADRQKAVKILENGRVVIKKDGKTYDLSGREL